MTRTVSLSRSRSSSWMISPWKSGSWKPSTKSCTGPIATIVSVPLIGPTWPDTVCAAPFRMTEQTASPAEDEAGSASRRRRDAPPSVGHADVLPVVRRVLDLPEHGEREVVAGDGRLTVGVEQGDVAADPVAAGAFAGRPRAVRAGRADEHPVEVLGSPLGQHGAAGLTLERLGPELL